MKLKQKMLIFEKECQEKYIKDYKLYEKKLDEYAQLYGYFNYDEMYRDVLENE